MRVGGLEVQAWHLAHCTFLLEDPGQIFSFLLCVLSYKTNKWWWPFFLRGICHASVAFPQCNKSETKYDCQKGNSLSSWERHGLDAPAHLDPCQETLSSGKVPDTLPLHTFCSDHCAAPHRVKACLWSSLGLLHWPQPLTWSWSHSVPVKRATRLSLTHTWAAPLELDICYFIEMIWSSDTPWLL
jgi:hypothetical protein